MAIAIDWLEGLESKVHEAAERLRALREENRDLSRRVEELETELAEVRTSGEAAETWEREREEIRRRVERLADGLEELIRE
jgi:predicted RNase H-like nuclease (RuvC/YqgF family)